MKIFNVCLQYTKVKKNVLVFYLISLFHNCVTL